MFLLLKNTFSMMIPSNFVTFWRMKLPLRLFWIFSGAVAGYESTDCIPLANFWLSIGPSSSDSRGTSSSIFLVVSVKFSCMFMEPSKRWSTLCVFGLRASFLWRSFFSSRSESSIECYKFWSVYPADWTLPRERKEQLYSSLTLIIKTKVGF